MLSFRVSSTNSQITPTLHDNTARNYSFYRNGNFCKGVKVDAHQCHKKISTSFSCMVVTLNLAAFQCFAAEQQVNECFFSNIDIFFIDQHKSLEYITDSLSRAKSRQRQELNVCVPLWKKASLFPGFFASHRFLLSVCVAINRAIQRLERLAYIITGF